MNEIFNSKLKNAIQQLPQHEVNMDMWTKVAKQLDFNDKLKTRLPLMPEHVVEREIWTQIETKTNRNKQHKIRSIIIWSAAASVALLLGFGYYIFQKSNSTIEVSQEMVESWTNMDIATVDSLDTKLEDYLTSICINKTYISQQTAFCEDNKQLQEINKQLQEINAVAKKYGDSPSLISTRIKLQNSKATLVKNMVNKLAS